VSTISRDSDCSAAPGMRHVESIAWKYDWDKTERGEMVAMNNHNWNALWIHQEMCEQLFKTGAWSSEVYDKANERESRDVSITARHFLKEYSQSSNDAERGRYAAPVGLNLARSILGDEHPEVVAFDNRERDIS